MLGSNDEPAAAHNCSGRPAQLERSIEAGERHFLVSRIKKAPDIAVLGQAACSY
jgi:hypothetical protein